MAVDWLETCNFNQEDNSLQCSIIHIQSRVHNKRPECARYELRRDMAALTGCCH